MIEKSSKKAYFVAPLFVKEKYKSAYRDIAKIFRKRGYFVWDDVNKVSSEDARKMSRKEITEYFLDVEERIKKADLFIAEGSETSSSIGFEVGLAVAFGKPALILRSEKKLDTLGAPFRALDSKRIVILRYNEENLESQIDLFLKKINKGVYTKKAVMRFTTVEADYIKYLQMRGGRRSFNAVVREVIEKAIISDETYQRLK